LAARGLDFTFLDGIVNFDFPNNINDYIHRAGRAGRLGSPGSVINLYLQKHLPLVEKI
jgi:superfamily II DNA/RNA helicase